jgi:competence ComEA-like helix-hairpin-helix protein
VSEWNDIFRFSRAETFALAILLLMVLIGGGILLYENSTETLPPELFFESAGAASTKTMRQADLYEASPSPAAESKVDSVKATEKKDKVSRPLMIDINTASAESLMMLPRVGAELSQRIIQLRAQLGGFDSLEQLVRVRGIGRKTVEVLRPYCLVGGSKPANAASADSASTTK